MLSRPVVPGGTQRPRAPPGNEFCRRGLSTQSLLGPISIQEIGAWPDTHADLVVEGQPPQFRQSLRAHLVAGVRVHTQFSGAGGPEIGLDLSQQALVRHSLLPPDAPGYKFATAGDIKQLPRKVLLNYSQRRQHDHVFVNILDRLPLHVRVMLLDLAPASNMDAEQKEAAWDAMLEVMKVAEHEKTLFLPDAKAMCAKHGQACPLYAESHVEAEVEVEAPAAAASSSAGPRGRSRSPLLHCRRVQRGCLTLMIAGTPCLDVSRMGSMAGMHGPQSCALLVWIFEIRAKQWSIVIHECTPDFDPTVFEELLDGLYEAHQMGLPFVSLSILPVCHCYVIENGLFKPSIFGG